MSQDQTSKMFLCTLIAFSGLMLFLITNWKRKNLEKIKAENTSVQADIYKRCVTRLSTRSAVNLPKFKYRFSINGKEYFGKFRLVASGGETHAEALSDDTYILGDKLEVMYLKNNPSYNYPKQEISYCLDAVKHNCYYGLGLFLLGLLPAIYIFIQ